MSAPETTGTECYSLEEMKIGDYIKCQYEPLGSSPGQKNYYTALGSNVKINTELPYQIPHTPYSADIKIYPHSKGFFYFIKVADNIYVADRCLNMCTYNGLKSSGELGDKNHKIDMYTVKIRALTNNEFDTYIVNGISGKITAGNNNVWHCGNGRLTSVASWAAFAEFVNENNLIIDGWNTMRLFVKGNDAYSADNKVFNVAGNPYRPPRIMRNDWSAVGQCSTGVVNPTTGTSSWTYQFFRPVIELTTHYLYKDLSNAVYSKQNGVLIKNTDNWNDLTDTEKVDLFKSTNYGIPRTSELKTLGKFKVLMYAEADSQQSLSIKAVPHDQLILPKGLINTTQFEGIDKVTVTSEIKTSILASLRFNQQGLINLSEKVWTNNGVTFTEDGKFGGKAALLNGKTFSTIFNEELNDFTVSAWIKPITHGTYHCFFGGINSGVAGTAPYPWGMYYHHTTNGALVGIGSAKNPTLTTNEKIPILVWSHIAITRKNGELSIFADGTKKASAFNPESISLRNVFIGNDGRDLTNCNCYLDDLVFIRDKALWTEDFTPPSTYLTDEFDIDVAGIKIIVTTDLTTYKTYDFVTQEWSAIDHADNVQIKASGIDVEQLATIPRAAWDALTANSTGIGFAYMIGIESTVNVCSVDKLQLQVDMKGSWDKAVHGTNYTYGYSANNVLNIKLLADGDYKINYSN